MLQSIIFATPQYLDNDRVPYRAAYKGEMYSSYREAEKINGKEYRKYTHYRGESSEIASEKLWQPLDSICFLWHPSATFMIRGYSYTPVASLIAGFVEILHALDTIRTRAVSNKNYAYISTVELVDHDGNAILESFKKQPVALSYEQRMILTAASIVNIVRGLLAICQLGWLFIPIDMLDMMIFSTNVNAPRTLLNLP